MSPYALHMEGITVTLCVQNRGQYVILFPGTYYSSVDCGFNCLEIANFATLDWLSHKEVDALQNQEKKRKSLLSYDKLLFGAASEAVRCLKEYSLTKKETADNMRWFNACGKEGMFSNTVKVCSSFFFACLGSMRNLLTTFVLFYVVTGQEGEEQSSVP